MRSRQRPLKRRDLKRRSLGRELAKGAVAGAVATATMELAARLIGVPATTNAPVRRRPEPRALQWALGIGAGAVYAALRPRFAGFDLGRGLGFGTGFWLVVDETVTPLLGLAPGPDAFPWQTHVRGFAGHLIFGAVADSTLDALDRVI